MIEAIFGVIGLIFGFLILIIFFRLFAIGWLIVLAFIYEHCTFLRYDWLMSLIARFLLLAFPILVVIGFIDFCVSLFRVFSNTSSIESLWDKANSYYYRVKHDFSTSSNQYSAPPYEQPHTEQRENTTQASAIKLVNLGLACIGRKTKHSSLYLTGMENKRHQAEYTFLRQVAEKYRDAGARKVIARHFMLYKECCLYIIYSVVLKHEPELHSLVKTELTERLTEGLTTEAKAHRKEYIYAFSRAFYEEYQNSRSRERTLSFTFWSVLCIKHPEAGKCV